MLSENKLFPGSIIKRINRLMRYQENKLLEELELHNSQTRILLFILRNQGCSQKALADDLNVSTATIAQTLRILEEKQWIKRKSNKKDRRAVQVYTTPKADNLLSRAVAMHTKVYENGLKDFSATEKALFESYLERMANNLQETMNNKGK